MAIEPFSRWGLVSVCLIAYLLLARVLRYRHVNNLARRYGYTSRESLGKMSIQDAYKIQAEIVETEMPFTFRKALGFALFKASYEAVGCYIMH